MRTFFLVSAITVLTVYVAWWLTPPPDAIGSFLPGFEDSDRKRRMIRDEAEQDFNQGQSS